MELFIVHESGSKLNHYADDALFDYLATLRPGQVINDSAAVTIAAWWHEIHEPLSTLLSTCGKVDRRMTRQTFASDAQYADASEDDRRALDALTAYIANKIAFAPASYRMCSCRDCFNLTVGIVGELCAECTDAGCTFGEGDECQRDDVYDD